MPAAKSPLEKTSSSHSRRPGSPRRSSSDKSISQSTSTLSKHEIRGGHASGEKVKSSMLDQPSASRESPRAGGSNEEMEQGLGVDMTGPSNPQAGPETVYNADSVWRRYNDGEIPKSSSLAEVERLRAAMNAQLQLNQHRERLARELDRREEEGINPARPIPAGGRPRVSPVHEEAISPSLDAAFDSAPASGPGTVSTDSVGSIRGGITPAGMTARTPSYPFPPMRSSGIVYGRHQPFTASSPAVNPSNYADGSFDTNPHNQMLPGSVTPASRFNFHAPGAPEDQEDLNYQTPNLYELSLMLSAEPGLEPWWTTVVQLMKDIYKAERVTLSVPADSTDIENVPWGQKATFNAVGDDGLSLIYMPRGSSLVPSSVDTNETSNSGNNDADEPPPAAIPLSSTIRPGIPSRHSFTAYEDTKRDLRPTPEPIRPSGTRPTPLARAKSYLSGRPDLPLRTGTLQRAQLSLQSLQDHMDNEEAKISTAWEYPEEERRNTQERVFSVLQALDYEADPLIDSSGVLRVLERGKVIALTRDYPYLDNPEDENSGGGKHSQRRKRGKDTLLEKPPKAKPSELGTRISSFLGSKSSRSSNRLTRSQTSEKGKSIPTPAILHEDPLADPPRYEEHEQAPPSPWAQSPAASPAVRIETGENPFFTNASVDEETFNPNTTPQDYTKMQQLETIGVDRSWTVLHIPLTHPLLSKPVQSFRLDAAAIELKSAGRGKGVNPLPKYTDTNKPHGTEQHRENRTPIAIVSILSPVIPYPSNLRRSLEYLAPHLATSFSLCRHHSNLENEIAGLSRKRPHTVGFGAVAAAARLPGERTHLENVPNSPDGENTQPWSSAGSITSRSDWSGMSRSMAGSTGGTPGWDSRSVGLTVDKRSSGGSPAYSSGESYFNSRARLGISRNDTGTSSNIVGARPSKARSPSESRSQQHFRSGEDTTMEPEFSGYWEDAARATTDANDTHPSSSATSKELRTRGDRSSRGSDYETSEHRDVSPSRPQTELPLAPNRQSLRIASYQNTGKPERLHTQLHSYGADFGTTFQSLPITTAPASKSVPIAKSHSRKGSGSMPPDMPPPSDRLKGLMLDSLPAHVFVALPQTGEIVWVNNRYLTYRGQTVPELYEDPWGSIHPQEREEYLKTWSHAIRTGEQFSMQVRIRRFDGNYRWFYTRAVGSRDIRGVIVQWYGSHMDIHDQHIAEVKAARQEEIEASEAKHRQLANLIPQIIFAATEDEGVTFANEQWLSYTGQAFDDALGLGFMDYLHPEDLAKCHIPTGRPPTPSQPRPKKPFEPSRNPSQASSGGDSSIRSSTVSEAPTETTVRGVHQSLLWNNRSSNGSLYEVPTVELSELVRNGVIIVSKGSDGRLSYTSEVRLRSKTGEYRWHLVRCVEVDNINLGSGDGSWFGACTDINDHKLLETKLKEAMESKGKFLSNMSHEIRTPLIGISGMVNFLQDTVLNDEQIDYTNTISSSATSLLNIINDILDLSKVDAGMMKLSYEWFHTRSLVEEVNEMVSTLAITKRLELNYVVDVDVPEMVKGDKFRIRQVLLNVIGNAIKFTSIGEVFTRCKVVTGNLENMLGEDQIMLDFSVVDTGRGFTQEEADLIFKPFSQIDGSSTRQHGGSGLGLVISRQLVELHGGKMVGSAIPNKGSTFSFSALFGLPTVDDHPEPPTTPAVNKNVPQSSSIPNEVSARAMKQAEGNPILAKKLMYSPVIDSPMTASSLDSAAMSSGSSAPSLHSTHSQARSSSSSVAQSLAHFGEAARSGSDLSKMKLALPEKHSPPFSSASPIESPALVEPSRARTSMPGIFPTTTPSSQSSTRSKDLEPSRPSMYSILLICPQTHSREATKQHIEITLPKDVPHQITPLASVAEAQELIVGDDPVIFTHIVLNLGSAEEIITLIEQIITSISLPHTSIVILSDPVQRQEVIKMAAAYDYDQLAKDDRVKFIYKPVKPSRFAVIFDPDKERDLSTDRNRSNAQQQVANQKQNYLDVGKRLGNKGLKVLLVEDNLVNQKVLLKFLSKVGIAVELALDGVECTDKVFSKPHSFYSLILVSKILFSLLQNFLTVSVRSPHAPERRLPNLPRDS